MLKDTGFLNVQNNVHVCFSISSTLMDMESIASSGRSTPAMMNGHGGASSSSSTKGSSYPCCWDQCHMLFNTSPDLAEHIRGVHVDGQRGGVSVCASLSYVRLSQSRHFWCITWNSCIAPRRFSCVFGKAVRCITHHPPVRAGFRDTCCHTAVTNRSRSASSLHTHRCKQIYIYISKTSYCYNNICIQLYLCLARPWKHCPVFITQCC